MPIYEYEHLEETDCSLGKIFEIKQSIKDDPLTECPQCHTKVRKRISRININCPKTNTDVRDMGFTKLVKRDDGVYENVTQRGDDNRYVVHGQPNTLPDLSKIISD